MDVCSVKKADVSSHVIKHLRDKGGASLWVPGEYALQHKSKVGLNEEVLKFLPNSDVQVNGSAGFADYMGSALVQLTHWRSKNVIQVSSLKLQVLSMKKLAHTNTIV
jgi:hypothetical protein